MMMTEGVETVVIRAYYPFRQLNDTLIAFRRMLFMSYLTASRAARLDPGRKAVARGGLSLITCAE